MIKSHSYTTVLQMVKMGCCREETCHDLVLLHMGRMSRVVHASCSYVCLKLPDCLNLLCFHMPPLLIWYFVESPVCSIYFYSCTVEKPSVGLLTIQGIYSTPHLGIVFSPSTSVQAVPLLYVIDRNTHPLWKVLAG